MRDLKKDRYTNYYNLVYTKDIEDSLSQSFEQSLVIPFLKGSVLDIGCGNGRITNILPESIVNYLGIDISTQAIIYAQKTYSARKNVQFKVANINNEPVTDQKFDTVLLLGTLEHTKDLIPILRKVYSLLHNNGKVIFTLNNRDCIFNGLRKKNRFPFSRAFHSPKIVRKQSLTAGFTSTKVRSIFFSNIIFSALPILNKLPPSTQYKLFNLFETVGKLFFSTKLGIVLFCIAEKK